MKTLKASVGQNFLAKAHRLFDSSPETIFGELVQNSRRAGATSIEVTIEEKENPTVVYFDNGRGIEDLSQILALSDSDWEEDIMRDEEPAGMGLFSLANLDGQVVIRSLGQRVVIDREVFAGTKEAEVTEDPVSMPEGMTTAIEFRSSASWYMTKTAFAAAVRYADISLVKLNGEPKESSAYVKADEAVFVDENLGIRVKFRPGNSWSNRGAIAFNFHGILVTHATTMGCDFHKVQSATSLEPQVELLHCRKIKMVHPARNAMVANEHLQNVFDTVGRLMLIEAGKNPHHLSYEVWKLAQTKYGVFLPEPDWRNVRFAMYERSWQEDASKPMVMLDEANSGVDPDLFVDELSNDFAYAKPRGMYAGYPSYDAIRRVKLSLYVDNEHRMTDDGGKDVLKAQSIELRVQYVDTEDPIENIDLDFAVLYNGKLSCFEDYEFQWFVTEGFTDASTMSGWIEDNFFEASDDCDAADDETQQEEFSRTAFLHCLSLCESPKAALEEAIRGKLTDVLYYGEHQSMIGDGMTITITTEVGDFGRRNAKFQFDYK